MALRRKVDDSVDFIFSEDPCHVVIITYITLYKDIIGLILDILEVLQITSISQCIEVYYPVVRILINEKTNHMAADKAGSPGYQYVSLKS